MPSSLSDYDILEPIGSGTFGTCKKIRRKRDGKVLVWKEINYSQMSEDSKQMLVVEVNLLRQLRHEFIVRYYDRIIDKAKSMLFIVMEYCEGGDLATYIQKMKSNQLHIPEVFVHQICYQVASALKECHSRARNGNMVLHRDLKPANIFLDAHNNAKIGDFGLARVLQPHISYTKTCVGTPYYMSPEQLLGNVYNEKSDVWSLGVILYELCALKLPFLADSQFELVKKVTLGRLQRIPVTYSDELFNVIQRLLEVDPVKRYSVELLLMHPLLATRYQGCTVLQETSDSETYSAKFEALRVREEQLCAREDKITQREASIEASKAEIINSQLELTERERNLSIKEKLVEERMARAEKLMQEYTEMKLQLIGKSLCPVKDSSSSSTDSGISQETSINQSCVSTNCGVLTDRSRSKTPTRMSAVCKKSGENVRNVKRRMRFPSAGVLRKLSGSAVEEENDVVLKNRDALDCDKRSPLRRLDHQANLCVCGHRIIPEVSLCHAQKS